MPRYFFSIEEGVDLPDFGGREFRDLHEAQAEAVRQIAAYMTQSSDFWTGEPCRMQVTDEWGLTLFVLQFSMERTCRTEAAPVWLDA